MREYDPLIAIAEKVGLVALDVGARRGVTEDLRPLASGIDFFGFEPDPEECHKLNNLSAKPWRSLSFIPTALGESEEIISLNLYRQRGCTSKYLALKSTAEKFSRGDYYIHDGVIEVQTKKLDNVVQSFSIVQPAYMKVDVQGMELEILKGSKEVLSNSLVAIRCEVNFCPLYENMPLSFEIDQFMRSYNFIPMRLLEIHEWRRFTKKKLPDLGPNTLPYSKGQMIHGDMLYFLQIDNLPQSDELQIHRSIRLGLIAACFDLLDHSVAIFKKPLIREYCKDLCGKDPYSFIQDISRLKARKYRGFNKIFHKVCTHYKN